jgi:hypothetical protein
VWSTCSKDVVAKLDLACLTDVPAPMIREGGTLVYISLRLEEEEDRQKLNMYKYKSALPVGTQAKLKAVWKPGSQQYRFIDR